MQNAKAKCKMQKAQRKMQQAKCRMQMQNAKGKTAMQNAKMPFKKKIKKNHEKKIPKLKFTGKKI